MKRYTVYLDDGVGIYGHDANGVAWTTFVCVNHSERCAECGKDITEGYAHGDVYLCCKHVHLTRHPEKIYHLEGLADMIVASLARLPDHYVEVIVCAQQVRDLFGEGLRYRELQERMETLIRSYEDSYEDIADVLRWYATQHLTEQE